MFQKKGRRMMPKTIRKPRAKTKKVDNEEEHYKELFEFAPVSLWEQDYSGIKRLFDGIRSRGVRSLETYLNQHPEFVDECIQQIVVLNVNQQTLKMFKAKSKEQLLEKLDQVFRDGMRHHMREELLALWNGDLDWSGQGVNYALDGTPVDIILHWRILPESEQTWERVLVTIEDITARKKAEQRYEILFEAAPISLWQEDYSAVKKYFDSLRADGVTDFREYLDEHPEAVMHCAGLIKVVDVNNKTLELFGASSKKQLLQNVDKIFRDEMSEHFAEELLDLWNGKLAYEQDGINYSLNGDPLNIQLELRVMPGHENDFGWVQVAIHDMTARKKAEDYLRYLGTHDLMTKLYNRAFFEDAIAQLENNREDPISIIIADLNSLKYINDHFGHQAGDNLIRRAAEVLVKSCEENFIAARIGGDEFAIVMPGADEDVAQDLIDHIDALVALNNKYYRDPELSISLGCATSRSGLLLEKVISLADDAMYKSKANHHKRRSTDK
jgi:diguanylate cyclase (GGDEF)-like protein